MTKSADPDQLASSETNWSGSTQFAKRGHVVFSKRRVKVDKINKKTLHSYNKVVFLSHLDVSMTAVRSIQHWIRRYEWLQELKKEPIWNTLLSRSGSVGALDHVTMTSLYSTVNTWIRYFHDKSRADHTRKHIQKVHWGSSLLFTIKIL